MKRLTELCLSAEKVVDDNQNVFSPTSDRQSRQPVPKEWVPQQSFLPPPEKCESVSTEIYGISPTLRDSFAGNQGFKHSSTRPAVIPIQGLSPGIFRPLDFCIPVILNYPPNACQKKPIGQGCSGQASVVRHIDITTSWNGLGYSEAQELYRIHQAFIVTLERMLASELWKIFQRQDGHREFDHDEEFYANGVVRGICFCRDQLVEEMADSLYSLKEDMIRPQHGLFQLYLAASDCLIPYDNHTRDTSITVRVQHDPESRKLYPIVEAAWVPDFIAFKDLNENPSEGQELCIVPQYQIRSVFESNRFPTNVRYSIESPDSQLAWLVWDNDIHGFHGVIPICSEMQGKYGDDHDNSELDHIYQRSNRMFRRLCIDVKAAITNGNDCPVNYERVIRARLTIKIAPYYVTENSCVSRPFLSRGNAFDCPLDVGGVERYRPSATRSAFTGAYHRNKYIETAHNDHQRSFQPASPVSKPRTPAVRMPDLAQKHADLAAKYADIAQQHKDAEAHVKMLGSFTSFGRADTNGFKIHGDFAEPGRLRPSTQHLDTYREPISSDSGKYGPFVDTADNVLASSIPRQRPTRQAVKTDFDPSHLLSSPTFNAHRQAWERAWDNLKDSSPQNQPSFPGDIEKSRPSRDTMAARRARMLRLQADTLFGSPAPQRYQQHPGHTPQDCVAPTAGNADQTRSDFEGSNPRLQAQLNLDHILSPTKQAKQNDEWDGASTSVLGKTPRSYDTEQHEISRTSRPNSAEDSFSDLADMNNLAHGEVEGLHQEAGPDHVSNTPDLGRTDHARPSSVYVTSASQPTQERGPGTRATSMESCQTKGTCSRDPSSNISFTVESPEDALSRSQQAHKWSQLSCSENSDKENHQPEPAVSEPRLSVEEKKAIEDAVERSLDELAGYFDNIFVTDSGDSSSDDDDVSL